MGIAIQELSFSPTNRGQLRFITDGDDVDDPNAAIPTFDWSYLGIDTMGARRRQA